MIIPEEQNGCRRGTREINILLYIDQHILKEIKTRWENVAMAWTDKKQAYDMAPQMWIIECLKMYKTSDKIIKFITNAIENWRP